MSTPAFTPLSPSRLSPSPRQRILKAARDRGWLLAPSFRQVAESSLAALRAGTLPDVALLPVLSPTQSSTPPRSTPSTSPQTSYRTVSPIALPAPSHADSDNVDSLCRGFETALRTANFESPVKEELPHSPRTPSPVRSEANSDDLDELATRTVSKRRTAAPHTPSPVRSQADSDDLDELMTRTLTRRRAAAATLESPPSLVQSDAESEDLGDGPTRRRLPPERAVAGIRSPLWRREAGRDDGEGDLDELCRGIQTRLRFPVDDPPLYAPLDVDKENHLLPALKGASHWLGLAALPFQRVRERAADRLLMFFDREVLAGQLVKNVPPRERVTLAWSGRLTKTAGVTRMKRLACGRRTAAIELSEKVLDEPGRLYNTLAHELCHAAAWILDECCKPPHGEQFKSWAREFKKWDDGLVITTCHEYEIRYKFSYTCQGCGQVYGRHSRSINTSKKVCGRCRGALELVKEL